MNKMKLRALYEMEGTGGEPDVVVPIQIAIGTIENDTKAGEYVSYDCSDIRKLGGVLFCDPRYNTVFVYHNGAESYYAARGIRGSLNV